jgi:hypothetical protein
MPSSQSKELNPETSWKFLRQCLNFDFQMLNALANGMRSDFTTPSGENWCTATKGRVPEPDACSRPALASPLDAKAP